MTCSHRTRGIEAHSPDPRRAAVSAGGANLRGGGIANLRGGGMTDKEWDDKRCAEREIKRLAAHAAALARGGRERAAVVKFGNR